MRSLLLTVLLTVVASSCSTPRAANYGRLADARSRWEASGARDYEFVFAWQCFCIREMTEPALITVRNGAITSIRRPETGDTLNAEGRFPYHSIEGLFDFLDEAIAQSPDSIAMEFDPTYGYPRSVWIDYSRMMADEERGWEIRSYRPER